MIRMASTRCELLDAPSLLSRIASNTGRPGSPLAGRASHPLDDKSKLHGVIALPPIPIDQQGLVALICPLSVHLPRGEPDRDSGASLPLPRGECPLRTFPPPGSGVWVSQPRVSSSWPLLEAQVGSSAAAETQPFPLEGRGVV